MKMDGSNAIHRNVRLSYIWPPTKKELKVVEKAIAQHPDKYSLWLKHKIMPKEYQHFAYHIKQGTVEEVKEKIITLIEQLPERFTFSEWIEKGNNMDLGIDLLDFCHTATSLISPAYPLNYYII